MPSARIDLPLDLLILRTLTLGAQHESLYPALHRLEVEKDTSEKLTAAVAQLLETV
jgi:hypothetical protein